MCDRIGVRPEAFLIAEALASNIGGTATLIGDPPNIIIASRSGLGFNDFLLNLAPIVVVLVVVFVVMARWLFRDAFVYDEERAAAVMQLDGRRAIRNVPLLRRSTRRSRAGAPRRSSCTTRSGSSPASWQCSEPAR